MFESDYEINGTHATQLKYLVNDAKAFDRYIDVYMAAAAVGCLYGRKSQKTSSTDRARIYADAFNTERIKCNELFKTVILSDKSYNWTQEDKLNICFRFRDKLDEKAIPPVSQDEVETMQEALELFNSYVYGGIEILYDNFSTTASIGQDEAVDYAYKTIFDQRSLIDIEANKQDDSQLFTPEY